MSSGIRESRAALLFLVAAGVLPASPLHVGSPAERLFGNTDVREVRLDAPDGTAPHGDDGEPQDVERQMELMEAELATAQTGRYPELDDALKELGIYIHSAVMRRAAETIATVAPADVPILILGESGTGKELFEVGPPIK